MKVYLLNSGSLVIDHSQMMWNINCGTPVRFPVYSVLVQHPEGVFLFDSGFDKGHVDKVLPFELPEQTEDQTLPKQLEKAGYSVDDVDFMINSHLHFDHVGGNKHLTNATTILHKDELREAKVPEPFERLGYSDLGFDQPSVKYELITGDVEVARGINLLHTPGHAIGHYSMLLETNPQPLFFIADVTYTAESYARGLIAGFHHDPVANIQSIQRVKRLVKKHEAQVFYTHDMGAFNTYKTAPDYYEG